MSHSKSLFNGRERVLQNNVLVAAFISEILCIQIKIIRSNYRTASVELCLIREVRDDSLNQIIYVAGFWTGEYNVRVPSLYLFSLFYSACSQDILYTFCA